MKKKRAADLKRIRARRPPPQPDRADLPLHKRLGVSKAEEQASAERIAAPLRQWWTERGLDGVLDRVSLATALKDLGLVSAKVLLAELTNPECPIEIRRHIAMTMAPKLAVEVRAALSQELAAQQPPPQAVKAEGGVIDLSDLLGLRPPPILVGPGHA